MSCILSVFCKSVSLVQKSKKFKKNGNHSGVRYVPKLSVPGNQFRVVPVSLRVFSRYKTMMYTLEVGSTIFTNLRRHVGLGFHFDLNLNSRVDIYTPSSTVKDGDYRLVDIRILKSGVQYQPKLIINIFLSRIEIMWGDAHDMYRRHEMCLPTQILLRSFQVEEKTFIPHQINVTL